MSGQTKYDRRRFLGAAAMTIAASELALIGFANVKPGRIYSGDVTTTKHRSNKLFETIKQIDAGVLSVGYAEEGPKDGPVVILLHGWPYDIYSFVDVTPLLVSAGYRVIIPYQRGY